METDLKALYESHYEQFAEACECDGELCEMVVHEFGSSAEVKAYDECGRDFPENAVEVAFDTLYKWDGECLVEDPAACVMAYLSPRLVAK